MLRTALVVVLLLAVLGMCAAAVARSSEAGRGGGWGEYAPDRSLAPQEVVRAYVDAINHRDGQRFCSLVAPWISGRFDIWGHDPDASLLNPTACPQLVHGFIGYIEDCCPPEFVRAEIRRIGPATVDGELRRVDLSIALHVKHDHKPATLSFEDVVWLVFDHGAWRIAKLSEVAAAASLVGGNSENPLARPDVSAERRRFARDAAAFDKMLVKREASYVPIGRAAVCRATVAVTDPVGGVRDWILPAPPSPPPHVSGADLRLVRLGFHDSGGCVQFEMAGPITRPATFTFNLFRRRTNKFSPSSFSQGFEVELRGDGKGRVTSGIDAAHRPIPVPAGVGVLGNRLTLVLDARSFATGKPNPSSTGSLPLDRFAFAARVQVRLSPRRELVDMLGIERPVDRTSFLYPSGQPCPDPC